MAAGLAAVDWSAPWLAPYAAAGAVAWVQVATGAAVFESLNRLSVAQAPSNTLPQRDFPRQFVPQADLPAGRAYEAFIFDTGRIPTRNNVHDAFNGLCWLHFPQTKQRLNYLQAAEIARDGIAPERGKVRDALTVFDENAAFLQAPDLLWNALAAKDWQTLFVTHRSLWQQATLVLFGHALLEKLVEPRKGITAHVYRVFPAADSLAELDSFVAQDISAEKLAAKPFAHLPVLGVPGWWGASESPGFYEDASVFRPPRPNF